MPTPLIQQLLNLLQAANVEAVRVLNEEDSGLRLAVKLFVASGATGDGAPLDPPQIPVGEYLVYCTTPGGETAFLTRAQFEVIQEFWPACDSAEKDLVVPPSGVQPLGSCTDDLGKCVDNRTKSDCAGTWVQSGVCPDRTFTDNHSG